MKFSDQHLSCAFPLQECTSHRAIDQEQEGSAGSANLNSGNVGKNSRKSCEGAERNPVDQNVSCFGVMWGMIRANKTKSENWWNPWPQFKLSHSIQGALAQSYSFDQRAAASIAGSSVMNARPPQETPWLDRMRLLQSKARKGSALQRGTWSEKIEEAENRCRHT